MAMVKISMILLQESIALLMCFAICQGRYIVDLTHIFDKNAPSWPLTSFGVGDIEPFKHWNITMKYQTQGNGTDQKMWLAMKYLEFSEHIGTHMDAPLHFDKQGQGLHEIPPERLIGPGVVIDVTEKARNDPNYAVSILDIIDYEKKYGRIPQRAIVIMNSGWGKKYPDYEMVFGTKTLDSTKFNFPGWDFDACKFLLEERQVGVVGVDTPSVDPAQVTNDPYGFNFPCHMYLLPTQVPLIEYVAHLDSVPKNGTTMFLGAIKSRDGTGGPTRIFAIFEPDPCDQTTGGAECSALVAFNVLALLFFSMFLLKMY